MAVMTFPFLSSIKRTQRKAKQREEDATYRQFFEKNEEDVVMAKKKHWKL